MTKYEKPLIVINEDLAEGVYAASGNLQYTGRSYQENGVWVHEYRLKVTNDSGQAVDGANVNLNFDQSVNFKEIENYGGAYGSGTSMDVNYNRHLNPGETGDWGVVKITTDNEKAPQGNASIAP